MLILIITLSYHNIFYIRVTYIQYKTLLREFILLIVTVIYSRCHKKYFNMHLFSTFLSKIC